MTQKILVTGAAGFVSGYLIPELLENNYQVVGIDNYSKYGKVSKSFDDHPNYHFVEGDVKDTALMYDLAADCHQIVAIAAMIGGISYFHEFAYDLLAENERITASTFDAAINAFQHGRLNKINVVSSSMVFESTTTYPTPEGEERRCPPPLSSYGFQKLATEYFARAAYDQYALPYTIIRPFNCIGVGERRSCQEKAIYSGNVKLAMSHVVPDLIQKILKGQDPLHLLGEGNQIRHYTYGGDLATGIRLCMENEAALNQDFNLSTAKSTSVIELAEIIWKKINPNKPFQWVADKPYQYDVQKRVPSTQKAYSVLGFKANTPLESTLDEIITWIQEQIRVGTI
ncbi:NAD(P)-dependent oxidoreductase [uncultured Desulfosarcina sp.]|uniref:NAD-dependent epimerase/dehydratase family protein n=1 Tax=uncultured Desulfosarcina sp. TaxID=218289 RepID=UPI0029C8FA4F|nr:NAD(P)-dependent oxidoreductase [uncultured Desulfosarcina sp.]